MKVKQIASGVCAAVTLLGAGATVYNAVQPVETQQEVVEQRIERVYKTTYDNIYEIDENYTYIINGVEVDQSAFETYSEALTPATSDEINEIVVLLGSEDLNFMMAYKDYFDFDYVIQEDASGDHKLIVKSMSLKEGLPNISKITLTLTDHSPFVNAGLLATQENVLCIANGLEEGLTVLDTNSNCDYESYTIILGNYSENGIDYVQLSNYISSITFTFAE